jgi:glycosyltransferase involved in cell wall biosynthesis
MPLTEPADVRHSLDHREPASGTRAAAPGPGAARARVVVFCVDSMEIGGTELNAVRTAEWLADQGVAVHVVCMRLDGPLLERYKTAGIPVVHYPLPSLFSVALLTQARRLADHLRAIGADVVHAHDRYTDLFCTLAARIAGVPVIIASKRWGETTWRHRLTSWVGFRLAHRVLGNSGGVVESLRSVDGIPDRRIVLVPNFVEEEAFAPLDPAVVARWRAELGIPDGARVVGAIGSLRPVKDPAMLVRAFATLAARGAADYLVLVGGGPSRNDLETLARDLGVGERVRFAGIRPSRPSMHHLFDVSVLCSRTEGFPNSLVEAMASGKPVVGTDVIGIRDAVRPGETGLLVPSGDDAALAEALSSILADPAYARRLGDAGRAFARAEFHADRVLGRLQRLYEHLLAESGFES